MLAGTPPFQGENLLSLSNAILEKEQPSLTGSSSAAQSVISRALSKDRARRFQSVTDLLGELGKLQSASDAPTAVAAAQPGVPSIAVLPFDDMSREKDQDYFCEGMAEEIINTLTGLEGLHVAARTSAFQAKAKGFDIVEIGSRLNVGAVLEGSVRTAGNRLRVTAQLINVSDGYHLWSERYDREMDDVFTVQDEIARAVVDKLKVKLLGEQDVPVIERPTGNLEAYHLVLKARYHALKLTKPALERGLECLTQALVLEPAYAQAHAGIATIQALRSILSFGPPLQLMPTAKEASLKALEINDTVADAHGALALVLHLFEWDWPGAEREYRRALDLNPGDTFTRVAYAFLLGQESRAHEAEAEARAAVERDPLELHSRHVLSLVLYLDRRFELAMVEARASIELERSAHIFYWDLGLALVGLSRYDEAIETFRQGGILAPEDLFLQAYLGWALGLAGRREGALTILGELERQRSQEYVGGIFSGMVCVGLGDHDQAISWLQQAVEEREGWLTTLNTSLVFDPLRADPRFQALLKKLNFPAQPQG